MLMSSLCFVGAVLFISRMLASWVHRFLTEHGVVAENYRGERIPIGFGVVIWGAVILYTTWTEVWESFHLPLSVWLTFERMHTTMPGYALLCSVLVFVGWLDDTVGERQVKGLGGHLKAWIKERRVSTGLVKAAAAGGAAVAAVWPWERSWGAGMVSVLLIVLMTNAMNLFDLRPGRSLKVYFAGAATTAACLGTECWPYLFPAALGALVVFRTDLLAKAMLGDTGSNLLGFTLGLAVASAAPLWAQGALLAVLLGLHWFAEKVSISVLIQNNRLLSWLDRIGRSGV